MPNPEPIHTFSGKGVALEATRQHNVDTDQIIPARFLKGTSKAGLGAKLFYDWRYDAAGNPLPDFPLNQPQHQGARILLAGHNFGCGSSREHAPWALKDFGFQAVLAVSFADIFKNNALKNRVLPLALPETVLNAWTKAIATNPDVLFTVNLAEQTVMLEAHEPAEDRPKVPFSIDPFYKQCLMEGWDDIGYTRSHLDKIEAYETRLASV